MIAPVARLCCPSHIQLSANLQRSLSQVVVDTAREQARSAVTATVHSVTPAVSSAVATALQQELAAAAGAWGLLLHELGAEMLGPQLEYLLSLHLHCIVKVKHLTSFETGFCCR